MSSWPRSHAVSPPIPHHMRIRYCASPEKHIHILWMSNSSLRMTDGSFLPIVFFLLKHYTKIGNEATYQSFHVHNLINCQIFAKSITSVQNSKLMLKSLHQPKLAKQCLTTSTGATSSTTWPSVEPHQCTISRQKTPPPMGKIPFLLLLFPGFVLFFFHPTTRRPTLPPLLAPCWDHGFSRCHLKLLLLRSSMNSWQHLHAPTPSTWPPVLLAERTTTRSTWLVPASLARRIEVGHGGWPAGLQGELVSYISVTHIAFPTYVLSR